MRKPESFSKRVSGCARSAAGGYPKVRGRGAGGDGFVRVRKHETTRSRVRPAYWCRWLGN
jgi:hypothetical protein